MPIKSRICIITSAHPSYDQRIFHKQAYTLQNAGYQVQLISFHPKDDVINGIQIKAISNSKKRFLRMFNSIRLFFLVLRQKADIIHIHDPELLLLSAVLKIITGRKVIYDVHEHHPNVIMGRAWIPTVMKPLVRKLFTITEKLLVSRMDYVVYTTPLVGERYKKIKVRTERIENLPLKELFQNPPSPSKREEAPYCIFLGHMSPVRGTEELINAFSQLVPLHPHLKLYLVGSFVPGIFASHVRALVNTLGLKDSIRLIPPVPHEKIPKLLFQAQVGYATYRPTPNNMSCLPTKIFEYMACGLPVIASDFPLYRSVINDVEFGLAVNPEDPAAIARATDELLKSPSRRKTMAHNARKAFLTKYNWDSEGKKLLSVYQSLAKPVSEYKTKGIKQ